MNIVERTPQRLSLAHQVGRGPVAVGFVFSLGLIASGLAMSFAGRGVSLWLVPGIIASAIGLFALAAIERGARASFDKGTGLFTYEKLRLVGSTSVEKPLAALRDVRLGESAWRGLKLYSIVVEFGEQDRIEIATAEMHREDEQARSVAEIRRFLGL